MWQQVFVWLVPVVLAVDFAPGVAIPIPYRAEVSSGTVMCAQGQTYAPCARQYDSTVVGVVVSDPAVSFESSDNPEGYITVLRDGKASVTATNRNGAIQVGDPLTTDESGLAVKGIKSGYMIGTALSSLVDGEQGEVMVALDIKPVTLTEGAQNNLVRVIKDGLEGIFLTPIEALRYVGAMIIVVAGAITAFVYFGRVAKSGVDAIGRNPLASQAIQRSVVLNVLLTMFIISVGVGVAYLILVI